MTRPCPADAIRVMLLISRPESIILEGLNRRIVITATMQRHKDIGIY